MRFYRAAAFRAGPRARFGLPATPAPGRRVIPAGSFAAQRLVPDLAVMSQANPLRLFVTHAWETSDDYLRVFEYLESARNFFYRNYSTPDKRPGGDREALREDLRRQIASVEAVIGLTSLYEAHKD